MKSIDSPLISFQDAAVTLHSPSSLPSASAFLWNPVMMMQANCHGYVTAQFMQPEPAKYAHAPNLEAKTFMQPEQPFYAHHPGRFVYIRDLDTNTLFSVPHAPIKSAKQDFQFIVEPHQLGWKVVEDDIEVAMTVSLSPTRPLELWQVSVRNKSENTRNLAITPYFPVGYQSWMNQSADYSSELKAIVCRSITPYQKHDDYYRNRDLKDTSFLLAETEPHSYECRQSAFEGDGGLHSPAALRTGDLSNSDALYETPTAAMQYMISLAAGADQQWRFAFGAARDNDEIASIRSELFGESKQFEQNREAYRAYVAKSATPLKIDTPDPQLDHFVNHWLSRQIYYHGDVNRLTTDPQTRNYLQDAMGMAYLNGNTARAAFLTALSQQQSSGEMPDGILLDATAELKYINQVPHMDHCIWLPVCLSAYLEESDDYDFLAEIIPYSDGNRFDSVFKHISKALQWLHKQRDHRGLNYIAQGDWCDPMNMVGYKGKGVSTWLTLAAAYACNVWAEICDRLGHTNEASHFRAMADASNNAANQHCWQDDWYARGITDDGNLFGVKSDPEGKIFLNPQSWAMLSGATNPEQQEAMISAIEANLVSPYGVEMLAPAYTKMREDIGRVTQKHPGSAENGSVYNHAAAFYSYALYHTHRADQAFDVLRRMIPGGSEADLLQRGQLPVFIPNYYRGAYRQFKRTAGRSSQLFNTGTVHWFYRCLIDGLFGLRGCRDGLRIDPQLPSDWKTASVTRRFRGAIFEVKYQKNSEIDNMLMHVDGQRLNTPLISAIEHSRTYQVTVELPDRSSDNGQND